MKTTAQGQTAEAAVADSLTEQGYQILGRNWKTKFCEIDIIAKKDDVVYFTEVKYRASSKQGSGFDYILPKKLKQIEFAAKIWNQQNNWDGDWRLTAAAVSGPDHQNIELIELF